jgi:hypothetical protein
MTGEKRVGLHVKCPIFLCYFRRHYWNFRNNFSFTKFHENPVPP